MKKVHIPIEIHEIEDLSILPAEEQQLIELSKAMTHQAYAPYSGFFVGAAALLENGEIVKGSNQENAAYPSGLCAERVAVFSASALYPGVTIKAIAVSARSSHQLLDHPVSPCGACRQVLLEYEVNQKEPMKVFLSGQTGNVYQVAKVQDLLPLSFTASELGKL
ncbi:MAG: cytidine deaminase [Bacteroidales bacterium]